MLHNYCNRSQYAKERTSTPIPHQIIFMNTLAKRIMIADDDPDDVQNFQLAMKETGISYRLIIANDGEDLLQLLDDLKAPDLIVLDLSMPRKNGAVCLQELRSKKQFDKIPNIILSTSSFQKDIDNCMALGANKYFVKPTSYTTFKEMVQEICGFIPGVPLVASLQ